jgi:hypothetical protein
LEATTTIASKIGPLKVTSVVPKPCELIGGQLVCGVKELVYLKQFTKASEVSGQVGKL